jgi:hypothetical protein
VRLAVMSPPMALEEPRSIEVPRGARSQSFTVNDHPAPPSEIGQSKSNTSVAAEEHFEPSSAAALASENSEPGLPNLEADSLGIKIKLSDAGAVKPERPSERSTTDEAPRDEALADGDDLESADDTWGDDKHPQENFEGETFAVAIEELDPGLTSEVAVLDTGVIEDFSDYDADARQWPWGDGEAADGGGDDGIRCAREKAAAIASIVEVTSRRDQEKILDWLPEFFLEFRHAATFRAIQRVAAQNITPDLLRAMISLRLYWLERPDWWVGRYSMSREVRPLRKGAGGLGWAVAVRVCRCRADYATEDMIDESWFNEWLALPPGTHEYRLFAAYVDAKVADPDSQLLYEGLVGDRQFEGMAEMGDDRGWWRKLSRYDESIRFGFSVLTPFRDGFGPPGYTET